MKFVDNDLIIFLTLGIMFLSLYLLQYLVVYGSVIDTSDSNPFINECAPQANVPRGSDLEDYRNCFEVNEEDNP